MAFIIGTFQSQFWSEHNQVNWSKITWDMCKSDSIFPYLQSSVLYTILMTPKQWTWNKIRHFSTGHIQIGQHNFFVKTYKMFQWLSKSKFLSFMTKVNPDNGNETKSDIFPWDIFKSGTISFLSKYIKVFQWLSKLQFLSFMAKVNPDNGNETKSDILS